MTKLSVFSLLGSLVLASSAAAMPLKEISPVRNNRLMAIENARVQPKNSVKGNLRHAPAMNAPVGDVIDYAEGKAVYYTKYAAGYDYGDAYEDPEIPSLIIFGDNNEVYFYNILSYFGLPGYVKGTLDGETITMPLPQTVYYDESYGYGLNLTVLVFDEDQYDFVDAGLDEVTFTVFEDGEIMLNLPDQSGGDYILGCIYSDDDSWAYEGDIYQLYTPAEDMVAPTLPDDVTLETYYYNDGVYGYPIQVGYDSEYIYFKGLVLDMPSPTVLRAKLDGNKATFERDEFFGIYMYFFIYTEIAELNPNYNPMTSPSIYELAPEGAQVVYNVDFENKVITSDTPDYYLLANASTTEILYLSIFNDFVIQTQDTFAGTPANPLDLSYNEDYLDYYGYSSFLFTIPNISTDGIVLKNEDLYYRIYIDDILWEFYQDDYNYAYLGLPEPTDELPFTFNNGNDIYQWGLSLREVGIYVEGFSTLGVQSVYHYDGETTESEIISLNLEENDAVESIFSADVVKSEYFDINGRRIANPGQGIYIMRSTLSDGSVKTFKVVRR